MIRYCLTPRHKLVPCESGWGSVGSDGCSSCWDEPQGTNCHNLVDENSKQTCPYCGNYLQKQKTEHIFGQNIRDAIESIKGK